ncbi:hypothetical protein SCLCIDRAFT_145313, partial [Scleroderma citrinum Foug A]
ICKLSFKIIHSSTLLLPAWVVTLKDLGMPVKMIPRDVSTRWNSLFDLANFICKHETAIESITDKQKLKMTDLALDAHEWVLLRQLRDILKDATLFFSCGTPNLPMVLPAMDYIDEAFTNGILKKEVLDPAIRTAIGLGKKTLNRYYSKTDTSDLYRIAMGK